MSSETGLRQAAARQFLSIGLLEPGFIETTKTAGF